MADDERRYRIDPRLATVIGEQRHRGAQQELVERVETLARRAPATPTGGELMIALRAHRWLLDHAVDGLPLTAAAYLRPDDLQTFAPFVPTMHDWIFGITREIHTQPVLFFRWALQDAGLLRRYKNELRLTAAGKTAQADVTALWAYLVEHLVPEGRSPDSFLGSLVLLHIASNTSGEVDMDDVAAAMNRMGYRSDGGDFLTGRGLYPAYNDLWALVGNVGHAVDRDPFRRHPSPAALAMIRDALLTPLKPGDPTAAERAAGL